MLRDDISGVECIALFSRRDVGLEDGGGAKVLPLLDSCMLNEYISLDII